MSNKTKSICIQICFILGIFVAQLLVGSSSQIQPSQPNAASEGWVQQNSGIPNKLNSIFFYDQNNGWAVGDPIYNSDLGEWGITPALKTTDGGQTWTQMSISTPLPAPHYKEVRFATSQIGWIIGDNGLVCKTTNGGNSWSFQYIESGQPYHLQSSLGAISVVDQNTIFVRGQYGSTDSIFRSTNGGTSWTKLSVEESAYGYDAIHFYDSNIGWQILNSSVQKTTNGGSSWSTAVQTDISYCTAITFIDQNIGWVAGIAFSPSSPIIKKTIDGGQTWITQLLSKSDIGGQTFENLVFVDENTGWAVGSGVWWTNNGGETWNEYILDKYIYGISFVDANYGWVSGYDGYIASTTNGGKNVPPQIGPLSPITVEFGTTGNKIDWKVIDNTVNIMNSRCIIKRDGELLIDGVWIAGEPIITNLDGIGTGDYLYEIEVDDGLGGNGTSSVKVTVTISEKEDSSIDGFTYILMISIFAIAVILIHRKHAA